MSQFDFAETGSMKFSEKQLHEAASVDSRAALERIHADIKSVNGANNQIAQEMVETKVVCDGDPPRTQRCHGEPRVTNRKTVSNSMKDLTNADSAINQELTDLNNNRISQGPKFGQDLDKFTEQVKGLDTETKKLYELTKNREADTNLKYDKDAIWKETDNVEKLAKQMDKTRKSLEKDVKTNA